MARRLVVALAFVAAAVPARAGAAGSDVTIQSSSYQPSNITIAAGTTVTWRNLDGYSHTVTADDGSFDSMNLGSMGTFQHPFAAAGTFTYHCNIHSFMHGTVTVTGAQPPPTQPPATQPPAPEAPAPAAAARPPVTAARAAPAPTAPPTTPAPTTTIASPAAAVTVPSTSTTAAAEGGEHQVALPSHRASSSGQVARTLLAVLAAGLAMAAGGGSFAVRRRLS